MSKFAYCIVFLCGIMLFNSCSNRMDVKTSGEKSYSVFDNKNNVGKSYGAYVAGRVAHLRKNFSQAADFYMVALQADPDNPELVGKVYLLLTSKGRIDEAAKYAEASLKKGDKNSFIYMILAVSNMKNGRYAKAEKNMSHLNGQIYEGFIVPFLSAWNFVGRDGSEEKNLKNAIAQLEKVKNEPGLRAMYLLHSGMIYDYMGRNEKAQTYYEMVINQESREMSLRALQIITNFYLRTNQKDKAVALVSRYHNEMALADMLKNIKTEIIESKPGTTEKILTSPNIGLSEALFNVAYFLRQDPTGLDLAHMIVSMAIYANPKYDFAKLFLADVLENRDMYEEANEVYGEIDKSSVAYYTAQLKKAGNFVSMNDYRSAELLLKTLVLDGYNSYALYLDLGDALRFNGKYGEAIEYYRKAVKAMPKNSEQHWVPLYALGIAYEQDNQWNKAEKAFLKALDMSQNYYLIQNYLGYSWLLQGKNVEEAFGMIADAYQQAPTDGHIIDSMGWAFYQLGMYDKAVEYLEKAAELEPANAVISNHLGDAYWNSDRKNEAYFQWNHTLSSKDDAKEVNLAEVRKKIENGLPAHKPLNFNKKLIEEKISQIEE